MLIALPVGGFLDVISTPTWFQLLRMAYDGRHATALVTAVDVSNHNQCSFRYTVAGAVYNRSAACDASGPGTQITVTYAPGDPGLVIPGSPASQLLSDLLVLFLAAGAIATMVTLGVRKTYVWSQRVQ